MAFFLVGGGGVAPVSQCEMHRYCNGRISRILVQESGDDSGLKNAVRLMMRRATQESNRWCVFDHASTGCETVNSPIMSSRSLPDFIIIGAMKMRHDHAS